MQTSQSFSHHFLNYWQIRIKFWITQAKTYGFLLRRLYISLSVTTCISQELSSTLLLRWHCCYGNQTLSRWQFCLYWPQSGVPLEQSGIHSRMVGLGIVLISKYKFQFVCPLSKRKTKTKSNLETLTYHYELFFQVLSNVLQKFESIKMPNFMHLVLRNLQLL